MAAPRRCAGRGRWHESGMKQHLAQHGPLLTGEALVDPSGRIWLPYDLQHGEAPATGLARLSARRTVRHAGRKPFRWHAPANDALHVINGMGVALGDSIIGMNVLAWLKQRHPALRIHLHRTRHAPAHVERLYQLAGHIIHAVHHLPQPLQSLPADAVDLSDFMYWPSFATLPMVDFFAQGLGVAPDALPAPAKANRWLGALPLPCVPAPWTHRDYVLLCQQASTRLRSMPATLAAAMVDRIWHQYRMPVLGFQPVAHPRYRDISAESPDLDHFMAWVRDACVVVAADSSAIHIAAGFDVPTLAIFTSIDPALRTRDYPHCRAVDARTDLTDGLHASEDPVLLLAVQAAWQRTVARADLPWPTPAAAHRGSKARAGQLARIDTGAGAAPACGRSTAASPSPGWPDSSAITR